MDARQNVDDRHPPPAGECIPGLAGGRSEHVPARDAAARLDIAVPSPITDACDEALVRRRVAWLEEDPGPRVGDVVRFSDGVEHRIAHLWEDGVQTSRSGSFYLSER